MARLWLGMGAVAFGLIVGFGTTVALDAARTSPTAVEPEAPATTTPSPSAVWFRSAELMVGPTVIVPERLDAADRRITLRYRLEAIAPGSRPAEEEADTVVFPDRWTLTTEAGEFSTQTPPWSREASFVVAEGVTAADVLGARLDSYWLLVPVRVEVETTAEATGPIDVGPDLTMVIVGVTEQPSGSVLAVELRQEAGVGTTDLAVEGVGAEWLTSSVDQTLSWRWSMAYAGDSLPDPLVLQVRGVMWVPIEAGLALDVGRVPDGP